MTPAQAPDIGGFVWDNRLRLILYPALNLQPADEPGVAHATLKASDLGKQPDGSYLAGVETIALEFTRGRLSFIRVNYPVTNRWESTDEFLSSLAPKLNLRGTWKLFYDWENKDIRDTKELRDLALECKGFRISAGIGVEGLGRDQTPHFELEETRKMKE